MSLAAPGIEEGLNVGEDEAALAQLVRRLDALADVIPFRRVDGKGRRIGGNLREVTGKA